jgi:hypothetical protein
MNKRVIVQKPRENKIIKVEVKQLRIKINFSIKIIKKGKKEKLNKSKELVKLKNINIEMKVEKKINIITKEYKNK